MNQPAKQTGRQGGKLSENGQKGTNLGRANVGGSIAFLVQTQKAEIKKKRRK